MNLLAPALVAAMKNPDRVAFRAFGYEIYWYGVLMSVGIFAAFYFAWREAKRKHMHPDTAFDLCLVTVPCGVIGARLYYVLFNWAAYRIAPMAILYVWEGGLAIYGAVIGGLLGLLVYAKVKKVRFWKLADLCAPGLVLAQAIGRWGNFFNQEAFGPEVTNPAHMWFPLAVSIDATNTIHYATFFYESLWCFLIFLALWFVLRKRVRHDGDVFLWYVLLYSFERALVEGLRTDSLYWGSVRVSQALSALAFVAVLAFFLLRRAKEKKLGRLIWPAPEAAEPAEPAETAEPSEPVESPEAAAPSEETGAPVAAEPAETPDKTEE